MKSSKKNVFVHKLHLWEALVSFCACPILYSTGDEKIDGWGDTNIHRYTQHI